MRWRWLWPNTVLCGLLLSTVACGGGNGMGPTAAKPYRGTVSDSSGDVISSDGGRHLDLLSATFEVVSGQVILTIRFAPGTFLGADGAWLALIDTDEDPSTGQPYGISAGMEYSIAGFGTQGQIVRYEPGDTGIVVSQMPIVLGADSVRTTFPLSDLNDDGKFLFALFSVTFAPNFTDPELVDVMPEFDKLGATR